MAALTRGDPYGLAGLGCLLAVCVLSILGAVAGSTILLVAALQHGLDAAAWASAQHRLLWHCFGLSTEAYPFGAARLGVLIRLSAAVLSLGAALHLAVELPGASPALTPHCAFVAAAFAAICTPSRDGNAIVRAAVFVVLGGSRCAAGREEVLSSADVNTRGVPSAPSSAINVLGSHEETIVGVLLLLLLVRRAFAQARQTGMIMMQLLPPEHTDAVLRCLKDARAHPGVGSICDESFWALDEDTLVGSLTCLMRPAAYPPAVLGHVQLAFSSCVEQRLLTVQLLNMDDSDDER